MAMTTSSSISVKPDLRGGGEDGCMRYSFLLGKKIESWFRSNLAEKQR
jgi:hypothetical protein